MRYLWPLVYFLYVPIVLLFLTIAWLSLAVPSITINSLVTKVTVVAGLPFYAGAISQLTMMFWCATATTCWFAYSFLIWQQLDWPDVRRFLWMSGSVTTLLLLDDIYRLHDQVFTEYLHFPEVLLMLGYLFMGIVLVVSNRLEIMRGEFGLFFLALALLGASIAINAAYTHSRNDLEGLGLEAVLKDGSKLAGILTWLAYYVRYTGQHIEQLVRVKQSGPAR